MKKLCRDINLADHNSPSYKIYGSGESVILIPGFAAKANSFGFQYRELNKSFRTIVIENKAIGSLNTNAEFSIPAVASEVKNILDTLSIEKAAIIGSSMGAMIALEFAQLYPDKVNCLILSSMTVKKMVDLRDLLEDSLFLPEDNTGSFFKQLARLNFSSDFIKQDRFKVFENFFMQNAISFRKEVLERQLSEVNKWIESGIWTRGCDCPSLFIYGSMDELVSLETTLVEIEKFFSKSEIRIIAGGGHAVHIEKFSEYNAIINEFLTKYSLTRN